MKLILSLFCALFFFNISIAQNVDYTSVNVPKEISETINSVVLNQEINIAISSRSSYVIKKFKAIRVYNESGLKNIDATENYDKSNVIVSIEAKIFNGYGKQLKSLKRTDFKDQSSADGFSILTDNRVLYLDYTPTEYPFTIVYQSEVKSNNTAFLPSWFPIDDAYESVLKSSTTITYPENLGFKYKEVNFENNPTIKKSQTAGQINYSVEKLAAVKMEELTPSFKSIVPYVLFGLEKFSLEGVEGEAKSWKEFGFWMYNNLLQKQMKSLLRLSKK